MGDAGDMGDTGFNADADAGDMGDTGFNADADEYTCQIVWVDDALHQIRWGCSYLLRPLVIFGGGPPFGRS